MVGKLAATTVHPDASQLALPGFSPAGENRVASAPTPDPPRFAGLAARVAAAVPDLFSPEHPPLPTGNAKTADRSSDSPPPSSPVETLSTGEFELMPRAVSLTDLEAGLAPRARRIAASNFPPPPARRTLPPPLPSARVVGTTVPSLAAPNVADLTVAVGGTASTTSGRRWIGYASAGLAAAAALVLSVNLLPQASSGPRQTPVAEIPRALAAEPTALTPRPTAVIGEPHDDTRIQEETGENDLPLPAAAGAGPMDDPGAESEVPEFDEQAAASSLDDAITKLATCSQPDVGAGTTRVAVTFATTGRVTTAVLEGPGPFVGTPVAGCIVTRLRAVHVPAFAGEKVTVHRSVTLPQNRATTRARYYLLPFQETRGANLAARNPRRDGSSSVVRCEVHGGTVG
jgi:hypothetical protein